MLGEGNDNPGDPGSIPGSGTSLGEGNDNPVDPGLILGLGMSLGEGNDNPGDPGSIPGLGMSLGEGNDNLLQYSCPENPMDRGAWWAAVHGSQRVGHA